MTFYEQKVQFGFGGGLTTVVRNLLYANIIVYIFQYVSPSLLTSFALHPYDVIHRFAFWQLFTYMFLHGNFFHIFFNLFSLFVFGPDVERVLGSRKFFRFYLLTGLGAGLFYLLFNANSNHVVIGASGAIYGTLVAFAVFFPNRIITLLLFFILPIHLRARTLAIIFISISVFSGIQGEVYGSNDGVAHLAHLGGALVGYLLVQGRRLFDTLNEGIKKNNDQFKLTLAKRKEEEMNRKRLEIDRILDRINQVGFGGITEKEKKFLKEASEFLSEE